MAATTIETGSHGTAGATRDPAGAPGAGDTDPSSDCAATQPYAMPSTRPKPTDAIVMCAASSSTIRRTCPVDRPRARSNPSSVRRCTTPIVRRFTRPTPAMTPEIATRPIMTPAKTSMTRENSSAIACPPALAMSTALADSAATANIVTSVTPTTTPIAIRLDRSG